MAKSPQFDPPSCEAIGCHGRTYPYFCFMLCRGFLENLWGWSVDIGSKRISGMNKLLVYIVVEKLFDKLIHEI